MKLNSNTGTFRWWTRSSHRVLWLALGALGVDSLPPNFPWDGATGSGKHTGSNLLEKAGSPLMPHDTGPKDFPFPHHHPKQTHFLFPRTTTLRYLGT